MTLFDDEWSRGLRNPIEGLFLSSHVFDYMVHANSHTYVAIDGVQRPYHFDAGHPFIYPKKVVSTPVVMKIDENGNFEADFNGFLPWQLDGACHVASDTEALTLLDTSCKTDGKVDIDCNENIHTFFAQKGIAVKLGNYNGDNLGNNPTDKLVCKLEQYQDLQLVLNSANSMSLLSTHSSFVLMHYVISLLVLITTFVAVDFLRNQQFTKTVDLKTQKKIADYLKMMVIVPLFVVDTFLLRYVFWAEDVDDMSHQILVPYGSIVYGFFALVFTLVFARNVRLFKNLSFKTTTALGLPEDSPEPNKANTPDVMLGFVQNNENENKDDDEFAESFEQQVTNLNDLQNPTDPNSGGNSGGNGMYTNFVPISAVKQLNLSSFSGKIKPSAYVQGGDEARDALAYHPHIKNNGSVLTSWMHYGFVAVPDMSFEVTLPQKYKFNFTNFKHVNITKSYFVYAQLWALPLATLAMQIHYNKFDTDINVTTIFVLSMIYTIFDFLIRKLYAVKHIFFTLCAKENAPQDAQISDSQYNELRIIPTFFITIIELLMLVVQFGVGLYIINFADNDMPGAGPRFDNKNSPNMWQRTSSSEWQMLNWYIIITFVIKIFFFLFAFGKMYKTYNPTAYNMFNTSLKKQASKEDAMPNETTDNTLFYYEAMLLIVFAIFMCMIVFTFENGDHSDFLPSNREFGSLNSAAATFLKRWSGSFDYNKIPE